MSLRSRYEEACRTPSDIILHLPRFVALVDELEATEVIELGSRTGVSTTAWLYALEGRGRLTTVDLDIAPDIGMWPDWDHIQGDDCHPDVISRLRPADIVFIDTSHAYQHTRTELALYRWLVKPGGVICCHDTELARPDDSPPGDPLFPVKRAVEEFIADNGFTCVWYPDCYGLAVIRL